MAYAGELRASVSDAALGPLPTRYSRAVRSSTEVKQMVGEQLAGIVDPHLRDEARRVLIEPMLRDVPWDYGEEGEAFACWIIADFRPSHPYVAAYCDRGFGPEVPFGIIDADLSSMGMDAQWFDTLEGGLRSLGFGKKPAR
jgi:hypothetical protein